MRNDYTKFHSQNGEDEWMVKNLQLPDKGIFVDVGAASAKFRNNTYHFEMNGWEGVCIDADPHWFSACSDPCSESGEEKCQSLPEFRKNYLQAFISNRRKKIIFASRRRHVLSRIVSSKKEESETQSDSVLYTLKPRTLNSVMKEYKYNHIDLLSIDAEAHDFEVWKSFNYKKYVPKIVISEWWGKGGKMNYELSDFLRGCGEYTLEHSNVVNDIFVHSSVGKKG